MNKIKVFAPAKINFTLDILGVKEGFHQLKSLVTTLDLGDTLILRKRNDNYITISQKGLRIQFPIEENNAYKSAKLFMQTFHTTGVDIVIKKNIPIGGGLGGSSADISAVLKGMKKLYEIEEDITPLANRLGSDTVYMLEGGLAVMQGRGEEVTKLKEKANFYLLLLTANGMVTAGECYKEFDKMGVSYPEVTDKAVESLKRGDYKEFTSLLKNDLYSPAKNLCPEIEQNLSLLKEEGDAFMTGSGSVTVGIYLTKKERDKAYKNLLPKVKTKLIKAKTI